MAALRQTIGRVMWVVCLAQSTRRPRSHHPQRRASRTSIEHPSTPWPHCGAEWRYHGCGQLAGGRRCNRGYGAYDPRSSCRGHSLWIPFKPAVLTDWLSSMLADAKASTTWVLPIHHRQRLVNLVPPRPHIASSGGASRLLPGRQIMRLKLLPPIARTRARH